MRLAVRVPNWLGDAVMALPAVQALRDSGVARRLVVLARSAVADVYRLGGLADEVVVLPSSQGESGWRGLFAAAQALRAHTFDAGLILPNSLESALVMRAAGIRDCWGYARDRRGFLLRKAISPPKPGEIPRHEAFYYLELLRRLQILPALPTEALPALRLDAEAKQTGRALLADFGITGTTLAVAPGAANSRAKQWPADRFVAAAAEASQRMGAAVAVFGTPAEQALCESVAGDLERRGVAARSLAGQTSLKQFIQALSHCSALITNDSGGMHIGAALGIPTAAIFGPTIPEETGPQGAHTRVLREAVDCSPCMLKDCPIDHRCMTRVSPERVAREALELVQLKSTHGS